MCAVRSQRGELVHRVDLYGRRMPGPRGLRRAESPPARAGRPDLISHGAVTRSQFDRSSCLRPRRHLLLFGLRSNSSTLLVRDEPGQPGATPRKLRWGPGTRSHGTGCRLTPPPAEISEPPDMGRALTKRVVCYGFEIVKTEKVKTETKGTEESETRRFGHCGQARVSSRNRTAFSAHPRLVSSLLTPWGLRADSDDGGIPRRRCAAPPCASPIH
jgi:hypothetical protein